MSLRPCWLKVPQPGNTVFMPTRRVNLDPGPQETGSPFRPPLQYSQFITMLDALIPSTNISWVASLWKNLGAKKGTLEWRDLQPSPQGAPSVTEKWGQTQEQLDQRVSGNLPKALKCWQAAYWHWVGPGPEVSLPGSDPGSMTLLWPWKSYLSSPHLRFLTFKMRMIITHFIGFCEDERRSNIKSA